MTPGRAGAERRPFRLAVAAVFVVLSATADERLFGVISDEQQMLATAASMAEFLELGIARTQVFQFARPAGDALSPYGMGQPLVEVPALLLAGPWERAFGARSSQSLFVLTEILLLVAAAAASGTLARAAGASTAGEAVAVLGAGLASPLVTYATNGYSEPMQAAALTGAAACAAVASRARDHAGAARLAAAAGLLAGAAVLGKGVNLLVGPFVAAPLVLDGTARPLRERARLVAWGAVGAALTLGAWLALEIRRFGGPFRSYPADGFRHPFFDGLWRLLVGANEGLLLHFPLLLLAAFGIVSLARRDETRGSALAAFGTLTTLLVTSASWWWWDGTVGWGPRFLVPAIPLLAAAAGTAVRPGAAARAAAALLLAGIAVNALGVFEADAVTNWLVERSAPVTLSDAERARLPRIVLRSASPSTGAFPRSLFAGGDVTFAGLRLHPRLLRLRYAGGDRGERADELRAFPWSASFGGLAHEIGRAAPGTQPFVAESYLLSPPAWPHLFAATFAPASGRTPEFNAAWQIALGDQLFRALDTKRPSRAEGLARRLLEFAPTAGTSALFAESLRLQSKREELARFLSSLPESTLAAPPLLVLRALVARDDGRDEPARALLAGAARGVPSRALERALSEPPAAWPATYRELSGGRFGDAP
ncbi:MAG TPA: hypothetical protein VLH41_02895 [Thermoanaerobaculia bacterium]|nr:hypothetical protein [Thermoanaerobaculia bacterium]